MEKKSGKKAAPSENVANSKVAKGKNVTTTDETTTAKKRALRSEIAGVSTTAVKKTPAKKKVNRSVKKTSLDVAARLAGAEPKVELSPAFRALAEPALP